jgi:hypothetical protein
MSIESPPVDGQAQTQAGPSAPAAGAPAQTAEAAPAKKSHLLFICYPRNATAQVKVFHATLLKHLKDISNEYEIFRDIGDDEENRINSAEDWRKVIDEKLTQSACCIIALFPVIFERPECEREVKLFEEAQAEDSSRFFYPVTFVSVANKLAVLAEEKRERDRQRKDQDEKQRARTYDNAIAEIADRLQAFDFVGYQFKNQSDPNAYEEKVAAIAAEIDRKINAPPRRPPPSPPRPTPRPPWLYAVICAVAAVVIAGGVYAVRPLFFPKQAPEVVEPNDGPKKGTEEAALPGVVVEGTFEPVLELRVRTAPKTGAPEAPQPLGPEPIGPGVGGVKGIRLVTVDGVEWYEFELNDGGKVYLEQDRMPVWTPLDPNIELAGPVQAFPKPAMPAAEERGKPLYPGDLERSRKRWRAPTTANVERKAWYRVAQSNGDVFFAAEANASRVVQWRPLTGCLAVRKRVTLLSEPNGDGMRGEEKTPGRLLKGEVQAGEVRGEPWYRFRGDDGEFWYVRKPDVSEESGATCG